MSKFSSYPRPSYPRPSYPRPSYPRPSYPRPSYPRPSYPRSSYPRSSYLRPSYPRSSYPRSSYPSFSTPIPTNSVVIMGYTSIKGLPKLSENRSTLTSFQIGSRWMSRILSAELVSTGGKFIFHHWWGLSSIWETGSCSQSRGGQRGSPWAATKPLPCKKS